METVREPGSPDVEVVGQEPHRFGALSDGQQPRSVQQGTERAERIGLVTDVVQRHRRPDHVGGFETVETVWQLGVVGLDPSVDTVIGRSLHRSVEHGRRAVDGDHASVREPLCQLTGTDTRPAADVEDAPDRRRVGFSQLSDPLGGVGDEGQQELAFQLDVSHERLPVGPAEVTMAVRGRVRLVWRHCPSRYVVPPILGPFEVTPPVKGIQ